MPDGTVRGAAVQAAPVFLDKAATLEKAVALIEEAGRGGAEIVGFPEGFIPAHPIWFHFHSGTDRAGTRFSTELFKNSIEVPGPEIQVLSEAAARAGTYVVMGVCEKRPDTFGSMYLSGFLSCQPARTLCAPQFQPSTHIRCVLPNTDSVLACNQAFPAPFGKLGWHVRVDPGAHSKTRKHHHRNSR